MDSAEAAAMGKKTTQSYVKAKPEGLAAGDEEFRNADTFVICCLNAKHLVAQDLNGKADPYVVIRAQHDEPLGEQAQRTRVIFKDLNPIWNPPDAICLYFSAGSPIMELTLSVYDWDRRTKDEHSGYYSFNAREYLGAKDMELTVPLIDAHSGVETEQTLTFRLTHLKGSQAMGFEEDSIIEYEQWHFGFTDSGWKQKPGMWMCESTGVFGNNLDQVKPEMPPGWLELSQFGYFPTAHDPDGWMYSGSVSSVEWLDKGFGDSIRRRVHRRLRYDPAAISLDAMPQITS